MKERISIIFILILGLLGVICGLGIYAETQWFKMNGIKTQGEIIELKEENDTKSYRATFVFRDINNNKIKTVSNISTSNVKYITYNIEKRGDRYAKYKN